MMPVIKKTKDQVNNKVKTNKNNIKQLRTILKVIFFDNLMWKNNQIKSKVNILNCFPPEKICYLSLFRINHILRKHKMGNVNKPNNFFKKQIQSHENH